MLSTVNALRFPFVNGGHEARFFFSSKVKVSGSPSVFSSDYGVCSSNGDVGSSKDRVDSSVGEFYGGN
jgi:hypothetical protein